MRRAALVVTAIALGAGCNRSGSSPGTTTPPPPNAATVVNIKNIAFNPKSVTVRASQTVAWRFDDGVIAHNVVGASWHSTERTNGFYSHTFDGPGTYTYQCTIHTGMNGDVVVTP